VTDNPFSEKSLCDRRKQSDY